jgi:HD superfamily phosphohydrolase
MLCKIIKQLFFRFSIVFCLFFLGACGQFYQFNQHTKREPQRDSITIHTIYGDDQITEPLLIDLLTCGASERLKYVRQYGVTFYTNQEINANYSRYEHSIGGLFLLRRYKAPLIEQAAGLLHDASHTVFSHVGDHFNPPKNHNSSYQDEIHAWYLKQSGVSHILNRYNIFIDDILITNGKNKIVSEQKISIA